jgi:deoxyribodipyrimidine photo-lyase
LQSKKFDPEGAYIRSWVQELKGIDDAVIHAPWEKESDIQEKYKVVLGKDYPKPMVDLKATRDRALSAYEKIKENADN